MMRNSITKGKYDQNDEESKPWLIQNNSPNVIKDSLEVPSSTKPVRPLNAQNALGHYDGTNQLLVESQSVIHDTHYYPEGGWGWVVCLASCWTNGTVFSVINTFGFLYLKMLSVYGKNDPTIAFKTAWVGSLCTGMVFFMSPFASILTDQLGLQKTSFIGALLALIGILSSSFVEQLELLYLTFGILLGVGFSLVYTPSLIILGHYFKKKMGLVNGLVTLGSSIFSIALSFLLPYTLDVIGLQWTMRLMSSFVACLLICPFIWRPLIHHHKTQHDRGDPIDFLSAESIYQHVSGCCYDFKKFVGKYINVRIWKRNYIVWAVAIPVALTGYFIPFVHLVKHVQLNFPGESNAGSILIMTITVTSGVSRLIFGKISDFNWANRVRIQQAAFAIMGITTICIPFAQNMWSLIVVCGILGLCDGCFVCLLGPIAFDIVGQRGASQALGFVLGFASIPLMGGPPIAGILYDNLGSYDIAFYGAGCPPIIGACIMFLMSTVTQHFPHVTEMEVAALDIDMNIDETECEYRMNYKDPEGIWHMAGSKYIGLEEPHPKLNKTTKQLNGHTSTVTNVIAEDGEMKKSQVVDCRESVL